jgi:hypothetical protein
MDDKRTIADRLLDVHVCIGTARDKWRDKNLERALYWLNETISEAEAAKKAILALEKKEVE